MARGIYPEIGAEFSTACTIRPMYRTLRDYVRALEAAGELVRVGARVSPVLEIAEIADRESKSAAPCAPSAAARRNDPRASPTGFPFKVVQLEGTVSSEAVYRARERVCDLGYLRSTYRMENGRLGYRCAAEPVDTYVKKGGALEDTVGRKCLCNALMADIGYGQVRDGGEVEKPLLTSGDDLLSIQRFAAGRTEYSAADVIDYLLSGLTGSEYESRVLELQAAGE